MDPYHPENVHLIGDFVIKGGDDEFRGTVVEDIGRMIEKFGPRYVVESQEGERRAYSGYLLARTGRTRRNMGEVAIDPLQSLRGGQVVSR